MPTQSENIIIVTPLDSNLSGTYKIFLYDRDLNVSLFQFFRNLIISDVGRFDTLAEFLVKGNSSSLKCAR